MSGPNYMKFVARNFDHFRSALRMGDLPGGARVRDYLSDADHLRGLHGGWVWTVYYLPGWAESRWAPDRQNYLHAVCSAREINEVFL